MIRRHQHDELVQAQAEASAAVEKATNQRKQAKSMGKTVDERVEMLRRLNRENNFAPRIAQAYRGLQ